MKKLMILLTGVLIMGLTGCGMQKYKLNFDGYGFESKKTSYAQGEQVKVWYSIIATDTDYYFSCDSDVELKQGYDNALGYVFEFTMPAHDVTMHVESRNSMEYDPGAVVLETPDNLEEEIVPDNMIIDYYEKTVATVGGDGYEEFVLYERDEGAGLILARYTKMEDEDEMMTCCLVPEVTWDECMNIVRAYDMANWNESSGLNGKFYVVKFKDGHGDMKRVTSDEMPQDGMKAFNAIAETLGSVWNEYIKGEEEAKETEASGDDNTPQRTWFCPECGQKNEGNYCSDCGLKRPGT